MPQDAIRPIRCKTSMHRSLAKRAIKGIKSATRLSVRVKAPKRAIAVIGAKLGGCGIRRVTAASRMAPAITDERGEMNRNAVIESVLSTEISKDFTRHVERGPAILGISGQVCTRDPDKQTVDLAGPSYSIPERRKKAARFAQLNSQ